MWTLILMAALAEPLTPEAYASSFPLQDATSESFEHIEACLTAWGTTHPFTTEDSRTFRTLPGGTRVARMGADPHVRDEVVTAEPVLVLVEPSVGVLSRTIWFLDNPNGWYCFDKSVAVAAKSVVNLTCGAHMADARSSFHIGGKSDREGGVSVFGNLVVNHGDCPEPPPRGDGPAD